MKQLPTEFESRMKRLLGDDFEAFKKALEEQPSRAFRVNTDKISLEDFERIDPFSAEKIPHIESGYFFEHDKIGNHPFHHAGMIYVQEPAAMMPAECLDIMPDWKILDMCAAPGGKSTQLKNKLGENGLLVSNEIIPSRCKILVGNVERLGLKNTVVTCTSPDKIAERLPKTFDMIMVDAPCSGEGMFRKEEIAIDEWSEENVKKCAERQAEILECAARALKDGGYMVYSTCTFSLEENEMTVDKFLSSHPQFEILPVKEAVRAASEDGILFEGHENEGLERARRCYPHKARGEGQFLALLHNTNAPTDEPMIAPENRKTAKKDRDQRKNGAKFGEGKGNQRDASRYGDTRGKTKAESDMTAAVTEFLDKTLTEYDKSCVKIRNGTPVYISSEPDLEGITVFAYGVNIGEVKKNYVLPHHNFFMAMGGLFKNKIELSPESEELKRYLHGDEFSVDAPDGWAVITVYGCAVGGAKVAGGTVKNHYPKGLRTKG